MEEDEIHRSQANKFPRVGNSRNNNNEEELVEDEGGGGGGGMLRRGEYDDGSTNLSSSSRFNSSSTWHHHSSRIIRVSRASGGKDRHSKVMTSKGLRDRRVRLSVTTAIQFYDLQDRLGYDQPSKAVEWLIKSASDAISELPSLNTTFPDTPKQPSDEKRGTSIDVGRSTGGGGFDDSAADQLIENGNGTAGENNNYHQSQNLSLSKSSACSSTSETSKGSGLSLSRPDIRVNRVKARERARERTAKEKEKDQSHNINIVNSISQTASFTELLTGGMNNNTNSPRGSVHEGGDDEVNLFHKATRQWSSAASTAMDYFSPVLLGTSSSSRTNHHHHHQTSSSGFSLSQIQLGHSSSLHDHHHQAAMSMSVSPFSSNHNSSDHQIQQQHYSFIPHHHLMPAGVVSSSSQPTAAAAGNNNNDYNLNFSISTGLAGYNRGTLQSNSPPSSLLPSPHLQQRFSTIDDGSSSSLSTVPFFMGGGGGGGAGTAASTMENNHHHQHHFSSVFDGSRLQLYSDHKGKPKN